MPYREPPESEEQNERSLARLIELQLAHQHAARRRRTLFHAAALLGVLPWAAKLGAGLALLLASRIGLALWIPTLALAVACWLDERSLERRRDRCLARIPARPPKVLP